MLFLFFFDISQYCRCGRYFCSFDSHFSCRSEVEHFFHLCSSLFLYLYIVHPYTYLGEDSMFLCFPIFLRSWFQLLNSIYCSEFSGKCCYISVLWMSVGRWGKIRRQNGSDVNSRKKLVSLLRDLSQIVKVLLFKINPISQVIFCDKEC